MDFGRDRNLLKSISGERVIYVLTPHADEAVSIRSALMERGFKSAAVGSIEELHTLVELRRPDAVLIDYEIGINQSDAIATVRALAFGVRAFVIAESSFDSDHIVRAARAGAINIFHRPIDASQMATAIDVELDGGGADVSAVETHAKLSTLSARHREVLRLVMSGETNKEIARVLRISPRTVESHRSALIKELGASNTAELIRIVTKLR